jgi:hypothetical protein
MPMNQTMAPTAELLSPELVLVSPELRQRAVLELAASRRPWELTPARIVPLGSPKPEPVPFHFLDIARMGAAAIAAATGLTLALTVIADLIR